MSTRNNLLAKLLTDKIAEDFDRLARVFRQYSTPCWSVEHKCQCVEFVDLDKTPDDLRASLEAEEYQRFMQVLRDVESEMTDMVNQMTERTYTDC
jgi:hypothetical protein